MKLHLFAVIAVGGLFAIAAPVLAQIPTAASDFFEQGREQFEREIEALNHSTSRLIERETLNHELPVLEINRDFQSEEISPIDLENSEEFPTETVPNSEEQKPIF